MKPRSAKGKGRRLQNEVRDRLLKLFEGILEPDDIQAAIMGESGVDIKLSPKARELFPYSTECKNREKLNIWSAFQQAEENRKPGTAPIVVFKRNRSKTYVAMELEEFLKYIPLPPVLEDKK